MPVQVQGNVFLAMALWRISNAYPSAEADQTGMPGICEIRQWTGCLPGRNLRLAVHEGGHSIP
ncbi:MAG: hypothetical protein ACK4MS_02880 [Paracoccaceae bacterium]